MANYYIPKGLDIRQVLKGRNNDCDAVLFVCECASTEKLFYVSAGFQLESVSDASARWDLMPAHTHFSPNTKWIQSQKAAIVVQPKPDCPPVANRTQSRNAQFSLRSPETKHP